MVATGTLPPGEIVATADHRIIMRNVPWSHYEAMLAFRGEKSVPRMAYFDGELELMSPSRNHESIAGRIGRLVEAYCLHHGIEFETVGSWTLKSAPKKRGVEPDECYLIGTFEGDRPHLAIEVIWTSGGLDKLEIYRGLGVGEVWFWRDGRIEVFVLAGETYDARERSLVLPDLDLDQLTKHLDADTTSAAIRGFRAEL